MIKENKSIAGIIASLSTIGLIIIFYFLITDEANLFTKLVLFLPIIPFIIYTIQRWEVFINGNTLELLKNEMIIKKNNDIVPFSQISYVSLENIYNEGFLVSYNLEIIFEDRPSFTIKKGSNKSIVELGKQIAEFTGKKLIISTGY